MPVRQSATRRPSDPGADIAGIFIQGVVYFVYYSMLVVGLGVIVWLAFDAFQVSAQAGARSLCAALLPVLAGSYLRWVRAEWLQVLLRVPNLGLMAGAAFATIAVLTALSAEEGANVVPQLGISLAFSTMLLARTDIKDEVDDTPLLDEKLVHFFFGIAFALLVYGLFRLEG